MNLLLLESTSNWRECAVLNQLSDHAAIAIANAQLYDEVQRANLAKSDFVSFVAHDLKNPMTSIKGYSELLAAGISRSDQRNADQLPHHHPFQRRTHVHAGYRSQRNAKIEADRLRLWTTGLWK